MSDFNYLDKRNADFKAVDSDGRNALHYVRSWKFIGDKHSDWNRKSIALVDLLASHGVDVNHQDISGVTPLMNASTSCSPGSINLLLSYGADPALKDKLGKSALDRAMERATQSGQGGGCNEVVSILMNPPKVSQGVSSFAGTYGGTYNGDDEGVLQADINQDGTATLTFHSNKVGLTATHAGKVENDGTVTFGSTGAVFHGTISRKGVLTGTWKAPKSGDRGSFQGNKDVKVDMPSSNPLKAIGSLFGRSH